MPRVKFSYRWLRNIILFIVAILSWTIFGQLLSKRGRRIWYRVLENYWVFCKVALGYWNDNDVYDFDLSTRFDEIEKESNKLSPDAYRKRGLSAIVNKANRMNLVAALVSTRVVLIQLIPDLTLLSTFAVDISSSPIFVFSDSLTRDLPALVLWNSSGLARDWLVNMNMNIVAWKVNLLSVYLLVVESRLLQFVLNVVFNLLAVLLIFGPNSAQPMIILLALVFFVSVAIVYSFYLIILLDKKFFPPEVTEVSVTSEKNGETNQEQQDKHRKSEIELRKSEKFSDVGDVCEIPFAGSGQTSEP